MEIKQNKAAINEKEKQEEEKAVEMKYITEIAFKPEEMTQGQQSCIEAYCLLYGHGIEPNVDDAIRWFTKSAKEGEPKAMFVLGEMKELGIGSRIDTKEAAEFYKKAAQAGNPNA